MQWNFLAAAGVDAARAWGNLIAAGKPGARGAVVAVLDTGVAYRDWGRYRRSPDFTHTSFVAPYDFVTHNAYPLDREGHGTFITGTVAESTNNGLGLTGLDYNASVMPVRVLDAGGTGDSATISRGITYAVNHGAQVINLSLVFFPGTTASDIPDVIEALQYAHRHGVAVVAAAGNDSAKQLSYPAADPDVISVGATTSDGCLADYSNHGPQLDLVAPGGGDDARIPDRNCHPSRNLPSIFQITLMDPSTPSHFGYPNDYTGTSMSAAHVTGIVAQVIASGVVGAHPTPQKILLRLEKTARAMDGSSPNEYYGYGLVQAGAATALPSGGAGL